MGSCSKKNKLFITIALVFIVTLISFLCLEKIDLKDSEDDFINNKPTVKISIEDQKKLKELININSLSSDFMENYYQDVSEMSQEDNENLLIVISSEGIKNDHGAEKVIEAPNNQYYLIYQNEEDKNDAYKKLQKDSNIVSVEENMMFTIEEVEDDTSTYNSWGVEKLGYDDASAKIDAIKSSEPDRIKDVVVAIIDTGLDEDLFNENYPDKLLYVHDILFPGQSRGDSYGHGTHIAGTIAESTPSNVKIMPVKANDRDNTPGTNDDSSFYQAELINAINYVTDGRKADAISFSIGGYTWSASASQSYYQAIQSAVDENIIFVASAGNANNELFHYPSSYDNVISVAAMDSRLGKAGFSNYGNELTFAAPGYKILSINGVKSGTSMATPHVTSAVALLKSFNRDLTLEQTISLLKKYAIDIGDNGFDEIYGHGVVNFEDAVFCSKDVTCDEYGVFIKDDISSLSTLKIEQAAVSFTPEYNYGNNTNIVNAEINFYYTKDDYYTRTLSQVIEDIKIIGYNPFEYTMQEVTIKYKNLETIINVDNRNLQSGWEYETLDDNTIKLNNILYATNSDADKYYAVTDIPQVIYIPSEIDGIAVSTLGEGVLADKAFRYKNNLKRIFISPGIKKIEKNAFSIGYDNYYEATRVKAHYELTPFEIVIPESVEIIDESAFKVETSSGTFVNNSKIVLNTYKNSAAHKYAINNGINYIYINDVKVELNNKEYLAFDKIDPEDLMITVNYLGTFSSISSQIINNYSKNYSSDGSTLESLSENINEFTIKYKNGNDSLRSGDTVFTIEFTTNAGQYISQDVEITVNKAIPEYIIPTGLEGKIGQKLSEISLPEGFKWQDETTVLNTLGEKSFIAIYEPEDKDNYEIVKDIEIKVLVNKAESNITYSSSGNVIKYDGQAHGITLNIESPNPTIVKYMDANGEYVLDEMPKYIEVGEYLIKFRIYIDELHTDVYGEETLKIVNSTIINNTSDYEIIYDNDEHTISIDVDVKNYDVKYSLDGKEYSLDKAPKFKAVGEHTVNYLITSKFYDDLVGSNKVRIYGIKSFDPSLVIRDNIILIRNDSFSTISNKIKTYAKSTQYIHYDKAGTIINNEALCTGDQINIKINNLKDFLYNISVLGDVNADGKVTSADYIKIRKHIMQTEIIKDNIYFYSADINNDGKISSADYVKIKKYIMNGENL